MPSHPTPQCSSTFPAPSLPPCSPLLPSLIGQGPLANSTCFDVAKHHGQGARYHPGPLRTIRLRIQSRDPGGPDIRDGRYKPYTSISGVFQGYWELQCLGVQTRVGIVSGPKGLLGLWAKCPLWTIASAVTVHFILLPAITIPPKQPEPRRQPLSRANRLPPGGSVFLSEKCAQLKCPILGVVGKIR